MIKVFAVVMPFPVGTILSAICADRENRVIVKGLRTNAAELLAFTRNGKRDR